MDVTEERVSHLRLGKSVQPGRKRPILVRVRNKVSRDAILEKTRVLKEAGDVYKNIYVKKDVHPAVRKEWNRLKDAERTEKEKPENQGVEIKLCAKERKLYRGNVVIDSWTPHPF